MNDKATEKLIEMYTQLETELLITIANHLRIEDEFQNSDYWRIKKIDEMGLLNQEVVEYVAKVSKKTPEEVLKAMKDIGYETYNIDNLTKAFESGKLKINPQKLLEDKTIDTMINITSYELTDSFIKMSKKIIDSTLNTYLQIVDKAYLETSSGVKSYSQSIEESIKQLSSFGIKTMTYRTIDDEGVEHLRTYNIESMVRREVLTNTRKLSNDIQDKIINDLECEYVHLSEHIRCRPKHFPWQGTIVKATMWKQITHYGEVDGLGGINCKHYPEPYFGDKRNKDLKTLTQEECEEQYNLSQRQRYLERGVRKWKREAKMMKAFGDNEQYTIAKNKTLEWQTRLHNFVKNNNLRRDFVRESIGTE